MMEVCRNGTRDARGNYVPPARFMVSLQSALFLGHFVQAPIIFQVFDGQAGGNGSQLCGLFRRHKPADESKHIAALFAKAMLESSDDLRELNFPPVKSETVLFSLTGKDATLFLELFVELRCSAGFRMQRRTAPRAADERKAAARIAHGPEYFMLDIIEQIADTIHGDEFSFRPTAAGRMGEPAHQAFQRIPGADIFGG